MPPPSLSITTNVGAGFAPTPSSPFDVVQEAQVAAQADDRPPAVAATPTTVDTKPSMPLAPRFAQHAQIVARRHAPLERAHGQARRDDQRARRMEARPRGRARSRLRSGVVRRVEHAVDRGAARALGAQPAVEPRRVDARLRPPSARATRRAAVRQVGDPLDLRRRGAGRATRRPGRRRPAATAPSSHALATLLVSGAPIRRRGRAGAPSRTWRAEQRFVGRDRVRRRRGVARSDRRAPASPPPPRSGPRSRARRRRPTPRRAARAGGRARARRVASTSSASGHATPCAVARPRCAARAGPARRPAARRSARAARGTEG